MKEEINNLEDLYMDVHKLNDNLNDYIDLLNGSVRNADINKRLNNYKDINDNNSRAIENELIEKMNELKEKKDEEKEKTDDEKEKDDIIN